MAKVTLYKPTCEDDNGCKHRATYVLDDGAKKIPLCGAHAKNAIFKAAQAELPGPTAVHEKPQHKAVGA